MYLVQPLHVLHQEAVGVVPGQEDVLQHIPHAFLLEAQVLGSHHWRVDQVQSTHTHTHTPTHTQWIQVIQLILIIGQQ